MQKGFDPISTAEGWQLSNAPVLSMAAHKASLDIFEEAGMERLHEKRKKLVDYLLFIIDDCNSKTSEKIIEVITCLLYTSDAADERSSVDLGGRRIIKKKTNIKKL